VLFVWDEEAEKSWQQLKNLYRKEAGGKAVVATFNYDALIIIETDASDFALGA
jgi:hypothetical protein